MPSTNLISPTLSAAAESDLAVLANVLIEGEPDDVEQATARLKAIGPEAAPVLLELLGDRKWHTRMLLPFYRWLAKPGELELKIPKKLIHERVEELLFALGPEALPLVAQGLEHPDFRVRSAAARVLVRHKPLSIDLLMEKLSSRDGSFLAADALAAIGKPAVEPLMQVLNSEKMGTHRWNAADAALSRIFRAPTRKEVLGERNHLWGSWLAGLVVALIGFGGGMWAELGLWPSVILGAVLGYGIWVAIIHSSDGVNNGDDSIIIFLIEAVTAPFIYRDKVKHYRVRRSARERFRVKHGLKG